MKKTKEISILIPFTSNPYYSSAYSILHFFLKTVILGKKMTLSIVKAKTIPDRVKQGMILLEALLTDKRECNTV